MLLNAYEWQQHYEEKGNKCQKSHATPKFPSQISHHRCSTSVIVRKTLNPKSQIPVFVVEMNVFLEILSFLISEILGILRSFLGNGASN